MNDIDQMISQLEQQKTAVDRAIAALREITGGGAAATPQPGGRKKRRLSPEGRERIAEATRRRWAAKKAAQSAEEVAPQETAPVAVAKPAKKKRTQTR